MKEYRPDTIGTVVPEAAAAAEVLDELLDEPVLVEVLEDVEAVDDVDGVEDVEEVEDVETPAGEDAMFAVSS